MRHLTLPAQLDAAGLTALHAALDTPGPVALRAGPEAFCRGMALDPSGAPPLRAFASLLDRLHGRLSVAVVEGEALGGGLGLACACQVVLAAPSARFGLPEALIGMIPAVVLPWITRRTGPAAALRLALTTAPADAPTALRLGLADELCERPDRALDALARRWACVEPAAIEALLRLSAALGPAPSPAGDWLAAALPVGEALAASDESRRRVARLAAGDAPWEHE